MLYLNLQRNELMSRSKRKLLVPSFGGEFGRLPFLLWHQCQNNYLKQRFLGFPELD
nr:hypothetical protein Iba_chr08cCG10780 [Ipomoea batatas]GMD27319.1 hypothetical protein Iba_chr08dCG12620 [Ipomoea batatas]GMD28580.1 hypothetical protein Iba_chr08eCG8660 [Ipomoea batatas]GMD29507.1 hypothetical protein Iba_chr08fCG3780 [Ipomoea batatas]